MAIRTIGPSPGARAKAAEARKLLAEGKDPIAEWDRWTPKPPRLSAQRPIAMSRRTRAAGATKTPLRNGQ